MGLAHNGSCEVRVQMPQFSFRIGRARPTPTSAEAAPAAGVRSRSRRPRLRLRLASLAAPAAIALAFVTASQPVLAENCIPTVAGFSPGHWIARGISVRNQMEDDISVTVIDGTGSFDLTIDEFGAASGTFQLGGEGHSMSWLPFDDSSADARFIKSGSLSGTGTLIQIDGEIDVQMSGVIDVEPGHDGDQTNQSGNDLYGFGNAFTLPFSSQFSPSAANCNQVFGSLGGPVEYGTEASGSESFFMAYRFGRTTAGSVDVQGQLAQLLEDAQFVLNMDPVDTDVLARFVLDMLQFESLLASLETCDPGQELDMGPAWAMLQSVVFNTIRTFLTAAESGAYTTRDVITAIQIWIQGGSLGWRADDCLSPNTSSEGAMDLFVKFEDVLLKRYEIARDAGDTAEMALIAGAAYQYGLPRVIAAIEES